LRIKYREKIEPIIPEEELYTQQRIILYGDSLFEEVIDSGGRLFYWEDLSIQRFNQALTESVAKDYPSVAQDPSQMFAQVPFQNMKSLLASAEPRPNARTLVFDGERLWQHHQQKHRGADGQVEDVYIRVNTNRPTNRYVPPSILEHWLYAFDMPGLVCDRDFRSDNRFPDPGTAELLDSRVEVDGALCEIVEKGRYRYYLDPSLDYAVRKREWRYKGRLVFEVLGAQFEELVPGVWLPRRVVATTFSAKEDGIPLYRSINTVELLEVNQPEHERFFLVKPPAGAVVIDENRKPIDSTGQEQLPAEGDIIPSVSYTQPANEADVEAAAQRAAREQGDSLARWKLLHGETSLNANGRGFRTVLICLNAGIIISLVALYIYRRFYGKHA
jgi:hypothetical protein